MALFCLLVTPWPAMAQATAIGVVDVQKLLSESDAALDIQRQIHENRNRFLEEVSTQEQTLRAMEKQLSEEHSTLPTEEFAKKKEAFEKQFVETRRLAQKRKKALDDAAAAAMASLTGHMNAAVKEVSAERGFTIVLSRQQVVMADDTIDISGDVLEKLNKAVSQIALVIENN